MVVFQGLTDSPEDLLSWEMNKGVVPWVHDWQQLNVVGFVQKQVSQFQQERSWKRRWMPLPIHQGQKTREDIPYSYICTRLHRLCQVHMHYSHSLDTHQGKAYNSRYSFPCMDNGLWAFLDKHTVPGNKSIHTSEGSCSIVAEGLVEVVELVVVVVEKTDCLALRLLRK